MTVRSASSTATISSQPMSRPSPFHPGILRHATHFPSIQNPIPQLVEASMHMRRSRGAGCGRSIIPQKSADNWDRHHLMSVVTLAVILWVVKGLDDLLLKHLANLYRDGRCMH